MKDEKTAEKPVKNFYQTLAKAQGEFLEIQKTKTNPYYNSKYADLADIRRAIQPALSKYGFALVQPIEGDCLVTILSNGEHSISSRVPISSRAESQKLGSELTYKRRYAICALLNIVADDDDDGNQTVQKVPNQPTPTRPSQPQRRPSGNPQRGGQQQRPAPPNPQQAQKVRNAKEIQRNIEETQKIQAEVKEAGWSEEDYAMVIRELWGYKNRTQVTDENRKSIRDFLAQGFSPSDVVNAYAGPPMDDDAMANIPDFDQSFGEG